MHRNMWTRHRRGRLEMRVYFSAPTGLKVIAQGNALGRALQRITSPVGAKYWCHHCVAPAGLKLSLIPPPRALLWAITFSPVGAKQWQNSIGAAVSNSNFQPVWCDLKANRIQEVRKLSDKRGRLKMHIFAIGSQKRDCCPIVPSNLKICT